MYDLICIKTVNRFGAVSYICFSIHCCNRKINLFNIHFVIFRLVGLFVITNEMRAAQLCESWHTKAYLVGTFPVNSQNNVANLALINVAINLVNLKNKYDQLIGQAAIRQIANIGIVHPRQGQEEEEHNAFIPVVIQQQHQLPVENQNQQEENLEGVDVEEGDDGVDQYVDVEGLQEEVNFEEEEFIDVMDLQIEEGVEDDIMIIEEIIIIDSTDENENVIVD